jgi:hypothetical protein
MTPVEAENWRKIVDIIPPYVGVAGMNIRG